MTTKMMMPGFPVDDPKERARFEHHIEHCHGWEYKHTHVFEKDLADSPYGDTERYPHGWDYRTTQPDGFHLNLDRGIGYDEAQADWVKLAPGILRNPNAASGPMLIAYWRRKR
jgi:hypothetical protein